MNLGELMKGWRRSTPPAPRVSGPAGSMANTRHGGTSSSLPAGPGLSPTSELPPANVDAFLGRKREKAPMVSLEEAAAIMGRSVKEVEELALSGVLQCEGEPEYGIVYAVRPAIIRGGRFT